MLSFLGEPFIPQKTLQTLTHAQQEYMQCYVIAKGDQELREKGTCLPRLEDYYECLHHKKEVHLNSIHKN